MSRKVLITGGAGFIGCKLAARLLQAGDQIVVFDNLHPQVHTRAGLPRDLPRGAELVTGDVTVAANWQTLLKFCRPDAVVHLAAETGTGQSLTEAHRHAAVNVTGTAHLLDAFHSAGHVPKQMLLTSSRAVYGDGAWRDADGHVFYPSGRSRAMLERKQWDHLGPTGAPAEPLPNAADQTHPKPISIYGATKLAQEHLLATWCRAFGSSLSVLRLQNVFGPGQALGNPYTGVLTLFAQLARDRKALDIYEDGQIVRDFVHVDDVVQAIVAALASPPDDVRTLDIGSGHPTTIARVAEEMARQCAAPAPVVSGKFRDGDVRAASCSIEGARQALGYQPKWSLEAGLGDLLRSIDEARGAGSPG